MPSSYLNQCCDVVNWTLGNKLQRNFNREIYIFSFKKKWYVIWKMAAVLPRPHWVNSVTSVQTQWLFCRGSVPVGWLTDAMQLLQLVSGANLKYVYVYIWAKVNLLYLVAQLKHYGDNTWPSCHLKSPTTQLLVQQLVQTSNKEGMKVSDPYLTEDQWCWNRLHAMTSS